MVDNSFPEPTWGCALAQPPDCVEIPEPGWGCPLNAMSDCGAFAVVGPSPFRITGALIRLMQYHFSTPDNIQNPQLKELIWTPSTNGCSDELVIDPCTNQPTGGVIRGSKILIEASYKKSSLSIQQRPAIFIKRETMSTRSVNPSFSNKALASLNPVTGMYEGEKYAVYIEGRHSIIALAQTGSSAEAIAEEIYFRLLQYMDVIKNDLNLGAFGPSTMSDIKDYDVESKKSFYATVSVDWAYTYRWSVIEESPIIKRLAVTYAKR